jgi:hypothetical protein
MRAMSALAAGIVTPGFKVELEGEDQGGVVAKKPERGRKDADDLGRNAIDSQRLSNDVRCASESPLPVSVAEEDAHGAAGLVVLLQEEPSQLGLDTEERKESARDRENFDALGFAASGDGDFLAVPSADAFEGALVVEVGEEGCGSLIDDGQVESRGAVIQADELLGFGEGKRLEEHSVDDAEDGSGGSDAEGEGEHGDDGEGGASPEHARGVACILPELLDEVQLSHVPAFLLVLCKASEGAEGSGAGILRRHAGGDVFVGELIEVEVEFVGEFALDVAAVEQRSEAEAQLLYNAHGSSLVDD